MKIFAEKEAEEFLEKNNFNVIDRFYIKKEQEIEKINKKLFPIVIKICGKNIIHKNRIGGVKTNIKNYEQAGNIFRKFKKIKNFEGILIQKQIYGKEFLIGVKKTPEFSHVVAFGAGGIHTEEIKDTSFRIFPFDTREAKKMIKEIKGAGEISKDNLMIISKNIIKICNLIKKYPKINELDINPLIVKDEKAAIVDARIVFD